MKRFPKGGQNFVLDDFSLTRVNALERDQSVDACG
jgi:hypothetical protein